MCRGALSRIYTVYLPGQKFIILEISACSTSLTFKCLLSLCYWEIQWNLSIADMLYSGHLSIAYTFPKNE